MNPSNPGQDPAVAEALARRGGISTPQLNQTSPDARMAGGMAPPPMPMSEMNGSSTPPTQGNTTTGKYQPFDKESLALSALSEYLKNTQKLEKEKLKLASGVPPKAPLMAPPSAPQAPQGMGFGTNPSAVANQQDPMTAPML